MLSLEGWQFRLTGPEYFCRAFHVLGENRNAALQRGLELREFLDKFGFEEAEMHHDSSVHRPLLTTKRSRSFTLPRNDTTSPSFQNSITMVSPG
jgi:hypothetical protein